MGSSLAKKHVQREIFQEAGEMRLEPHAALRKQRFAEEAVMGEHLRANQKRKKGVVHEDRVCPCAETGDRKGKSVGGRLVSD
jgi:hypothetical protein